MVVGGAIAQRPVSPSSPSVPYPVLGGLPLAERSPALPRLGPVPVPAKGNTSLTTETWPGFAGAGNLSGNSPSVGPTTNATLWRAYAGAAPLHADGLPSPSSPAVADGLVFVGTGHGGGVLALNESTGALVWNTELPGDPVIYGGVLVADHKVFVPASSNGASGPGLLFALNATTGVVLGGSTNGIVGALENTPNLIDGTLVDGDTQGYLYGWNESGNLSYSFDLGTQVSQPVSVADLGGRALALAVSGPDVVAYDALTGGSFPGISWSPYALPHPVNGSVAETPFSWTARNGTRFSLDLAVVADDGGAERTSDVEVLSLLPSGLPSSAHGPEVASWTTPGTDQGFVGSPALLGQRGSNLSFALPQANGSVALFQFSLNGSGVGELAPTSFLALGNGTNTTSSPVVNGAEGGTLYLATTTGSVEAFSISDHQLEWRSSSSGSILTSPAIAGTKLFVKDANGTVLAFGGGSTPPGATRLLIAPSPPPWVEGGSRTNLTVTVHVWYTNGSEVPADGGKVTLSTREGNVSGSPANISSRGVANLSYFAPTVSRETNATLFVNATWRALANQTAVTTVVVPPKLVNTTPLWVVPSPVLPPVLYSGEVVPINFTVTVGSGGPPLSDALVGLQAFGGEVSPASATTNSSGVISATFTAGVPSTGSSGSGVTLTVEKAGYQLGTYSWVAVVNAPPMLQVGFEPTALLVVADSSATFEVLVNSTLGRSVPGAVVDLLLSSPEGNLSTAGGITGANGGLEATYTAPVRVSAPGVSTSIEVTASSSGYTPWSGSIDLTLVPNATAPPPAAGQGPSWTQPLGAGLGEGGWGVVALVLVLATAVVYLLRRPRLPARPSVSVWDDSAGPEVTGRRGGSSSERSSEGAGTAEGLRSAEDAPSKDHA